MNSEEFRQQVQALEESVASMRSWIQVKQSVLDAYAWKIDDLRSQLRQRKWKRGSASDLKLELDHAQIRYDALQESLTHEQHVLEEQQQILDQYHRERSAQKVEALVSAVVGDQSPIESQPLSPASQRLMAEFTTVPVSGTVDPAPGDWSSQPSQGAASSASIPVAGDADSAPWNGLQESRHPLANSEEHGVGNLNADLGNLDLAAAIATDALSLERLELSSIEQETAELVVDSGTPDLSPWLSQQSSDEDITVADLGLSNFIEIDYSISSAAVPFVGETPPLGSETLGLDDQTEENHRLDLNMPLDDPFPAWMAEDLMPAVTAEDQQGVDQALRDLEAMSLPDVDSVLKREDCLSVESPEALILEDELWGLPELELSEDFDHQGSELDWDIDLDLLDVSFSLNKAPHPSPTPDPTSVLFAKLQEDETAILHPELSPDVAQTLDHQIQLREAEVSSLASWIAQQEEELVSYRRIIQNLRDQLKFEAMHLRPTVEIRQELDAVLQQYETLAQSVKLQRQKLTKTQHQLDETYDVVARLQWAQVLEGTIAKTMFWIRQQQEELAACHWTIQDLRDRLKREDGNPRTILGIRQELEYALEQYAVLEHSIGLQQEKLAEQQHQLDEYYTQTS